MSDVTRRAFLGAAAIAATPAVNLLAQGGNIEKNVVFGKGGGLDLKLDIYRPKPGTAKRAATIHLHGGGFTGGSGAREHGGKYEAAHDQAMIPFTTLPATSVSRKSRP